MEGVSGGGGGGSAAMVAWVAQWLAVVYVCGGLAMAVIMSVRASRSIVKPHFSKPAAGAPLSTHAIAMPHYWGTAGDPRTDYGLEFEDVAFPAWDGKTLRGWFVPPAPPSVRGARHQPYVVIVCAHGGGRDRRSFLRHVPFLHDAGYGVLLYDMRGHGASDGTGMGLSHGLREHEDVLAAASFVGGHAPVRAVVLMGTSVGAASCIVAAARSRIDPAVGRLPRIAGVIAENPFASIVANVKGIVELQVFWHLLAAESRLLYALWWPMMKVTQGLAAWSVRRALQAAWAANVAEVARHRPAAAPLPPPPAAATTDASDGGGVRKRAVAASSSAAAAAAAAAAVAAAGSVPHGTVTSVGLPATADVPPRPTAAATWWDWQEPDVAVTHLGPAIPLFLMHGPSDRLIHMTHSQRLFAAAAEPKRLWVAEGAAHCALYNAHPAEYEARVKEFVSECMDRAPA